MIKNIYFHRIFCSNSFTFLLYTLLKGVFMVWGKASSDIDTAISSGFLQSFQQNIFKMGLFYSTYTYLTSFYEPDKKVDLSETKIKVSASKLIQYLKLQQANLQDRAKKIQMELLKKIQSPEHVRNKKVEEGLIRDILANSFHLGAYQELIVCAKIIKNEARMIEKQQMSKKCQVSVCSILYAYQTFNLSKYIQIEDLVSNPYPKIPISHISNTLRDCLKENNITKQALNIYVLEMCYRNKIELEKVNSVGHKFMSNPEKYDDRESKSSFLFAFQFQQDEQFSQNMIEEQKMKMQERHQL